MTDFLHPQSLPPTSPSREDVLDISVDKDVQAVAPPVQENKTEVVNATPSSAENEVESLAQDHRNFGTSVTQRRKSVQEELSEPHEEVKRVVRKESPLFIHYYQSLFLLLISLFSLSGYLVLNPLIKDFKKTNEMIKVSLQESDDATDFLRSVNGSIKAAQSISPETLSKVNEALPREVEIPKLLKTFALIADQNRVTMSGIQFSAQDAASGSPTYQGYSLATVQISLSIQAPGYLVMRKYLEDLQTNIRLMDVKTISVSGDNASGAFSYSLELVTYYLQKTSTKPSAPVSGPGGAALPPSAPTGSVNDI
jgi:hypothetical protein